MGPKSDLIVACSTRDVEVLSCIAVEPDYGGAGMNAETVFAVLVAIFAFVGAFDLLPIIVRKLSAVIRETLEEFGKLVLWFREWRERIWPPPPPPSPDSSDNPLPDQ